MKTIQYL